MRQLGILLLFVASHFCAGVALADISTSADWFSKLSQNERYLLQADLVLTGDYDRLIDGEFGKGTFNAIVAFQRRTGATQDGVLTDRQRTDLRQSASQKYNEYGFTETKDQDTKLGIFIPVRYLPNSTRSKSGRLYSSADGSVSLELIRRPFASQTFEQFFGTLATTNGERIVTYSHFDDSAFSISGFVDRSPFYVHFYRTSDASVGYSLSWTNDRKSEGNILSIMLANFSYPLEQENPPPSQGGPENNSSQGDVASGSGFFVNEHGLIATNFHVAGDCASIEVVGHGPAKLVAGDADKDLAVVRLIRDETTPYASIRKEKPNLAEGVVLVGYPLADILNSSLNVSTGIVSAETGIGGTADWFTTNAGIQPGNSGGPILDLHGQVVGVAVAKLDDAKLLKETGDVAPNVGFGITNTTLLDFLSVFDHHVVGSSSAVSLTPPEVVGLAKAFAVQVICRGHN